uniref:Uncharacterized protein n=1 Tax=Ascaris lumbricoides TaxID=6252 RepID=A0A0M3IAT7_ASCLU
MHCRSRKLAIQCRQHYFYNANGIIRSQYRSSTLWL